MVREIFVEVVKGFEYVLPNEKMKMLQRFIADERGPTAVEYAIMLALIILVCASAIGSIGTAAYSSLWNAVEALE